MSAAGQSLRLRVVPNARRTECLGALETGEIRIRLASPAVDGKANRALIEFLAKSLGIPKRSIAIVRGEKSRSKMVAIDGVDCREAFRSLVDALP